MPSAIVNSPNAAIRRAPNRSATHPIRMPPSPDPMYAADPASAGTDRGTSSPAAICFSATTATSGAPNATVKIANDAATTTHDVRLSIVSIPASYARPARLTTPPRPPNTSLRQVSVKKSSYNPKKVTIPSCHGPYS